MANTLCLYTIIRNISGQTLTLDFLPPHGKVLATGTDYSFFGEIFDFLQLPSGQIDKRRQTSFENALLNGLITIISVPANINYDAGASKVKITGINNGSFTGSDPCYGSYTGAS